MLKKQAQVLLFVLVLIAGLLAVSSQSLWIDEANSAEKAMAPTLSMFWKQMVERSGSDLQMLAYMFYLWLWEKGFGHSEWMLRTANIPWLLLGLCFLICGLSVSRRPLAVWVGGLLAIWPLVWIYMDEARPYIIQLAGGCAIAGAIFRVGMLDARDRVNDRITWWLGAWGYVILAASSLLGVLFGGAGVLALWVVSGEDWRARLRLPFKQLGPFLLIGVSSILLGPYYLWTLFQDGEVASIGGNVLQLLAFTAYELGGFSGLGPARLVLRELGPSALVPYAPGLLALSAAWFVLIGLFAWAVIRGARTEMSRAHWAAAVISMALPCLLILALSVAKDFRFLGRHFIPVLPLICVFTGIILATLWERRNRVCKVAVVAFCALLAYSSLNYRFHSRHAKDDYRGAAELALAELEQGGVVWWVAEFAAARYYGLVRSKPIGGNEHWVRIHSAGARQGGLIKLFGVESAALVHLPRPNLVLYSKPDVYDARGAVRLWMEGGGYEQTAAFPAFQVWEPTLEEDHE